MIVPMRKLSLLVFYKDYQDFLEELRDRGVVHIHENKKRSAEDEELKQKLAVIKRIVEITKQLSKRVPKKKCLLLICWSVGLWRLNRKTSWLFIGRFSTRRSSCLKNRK